jgi:hypothetical protein
MDSAFSHALLTALGLIGGPIIGLLLYSLFEGNRKFIIGIISILALLGLFTLSNFSFKSDNLDLLIPIAFFIAYCYLVFHFQLIDNKAFRGISLVVGFIPIIFVFLFGIIEIIGAGLASAHEVAYKKINVNGNYYFRVYEYGNAISDMDGTSIEINKSVDNIPFIEQRIFQIELNSKYYKQDSISVKFVESPTHYVVKIYSKDILQTDTTINR